MAEQVNNKSGDAVAKKIATDKSLESARFNLMLGGANDVLASQSTMRNAVGNYKNMSSQAFEDETNASLLDRNALLMLSDSRDLQSNIKTAGSEMIGEQVQDIVKSGAIIGTGDTEEILEETSYQVLKEISGIEAKAQIQKAGMERQAKGLRAQASYKRQSAKDILKYGKMNSAIQAGVGAAKIYSGSGYK